MHICIHIIMYIFIHTSYVHIYSGKSFILGLLDLRCLAPIPDFNTYDGGSNRNDFVKAWSPHYGKWMYICIYI
jgi:hypothetical protein